MSKLLVFALIALAAIASSWNSPDTFGAQFRCENSDCFVSAGATSQALIVALVVLVFLFAYSQRDQRTTQLAVVGVWRRFGAFLLDFTTIMMVAVPIGAMPMLVAEYYYTGSFQWSFEREFVRPTDVPLIMPIALGIFLVMYFYFSLPPKRGRQTVGQYVLGYRVIASGNADVPTYGRRALLSFVGLCAWPLSVVLALRHERKAFWWDTATGSQVVRVGS